MKSTQWRVRNDEAVTDQWNIGELDMMDDSGKNLTLGDKMVKKVICSYNYDDRLLNVVHDGENCTVGYAMYGNPKVWAGSPLPEGQAVGGSWLGYEFFEPQEVTSVRMAQGETDFEDRFQGVQRVLLEAMVDGSWVKVQVLFFKMPVAIGEPPEVHYAPAPVLY